MSGGFIMPKNSELLWVFFLLLYLNKRSDLLHHLHRMTEVLNKMDNISGTVNSISDINSIIQKVGPMMAAFNSFQSDTSDEYYGENRNSIF